MFIFIFLSSNHPVYIISPYSVGPPECRGPQNVDFWKNCFLTQAIKLYMAKWYLTSCLDIYYEIQTGSANLNKNFRFISHHCRSNIAGEFCSNFHQYPSTLWLVENKFVWWGIFQLRINHSLEKIWWFKSVLFWVWL